MNDILFGNNNKTIIKKLAKKSVMFDKQRLLYTSVTIVITVTLIMTLTCTLLFTQHKMSMQAEKMPQAFLHSINVDVYDALKNDDRVEKIISVYSFEPIKYSDNISLHATFCNDPSYFSGIELKGELPQQANEIVLTSGSLAYLPDDAAIGNNLSLNLGDGDREYVVSGIIELSSERTRLISVYCSKEYLLETVATEEIDYTLYLYFNGYKNMSQNDIAKQLEQISEKYNIPANNTSINMQYFTLACREMNIQEALQFLLITLVVLFAAVVVIYNIFYISITRKTQEYGQLRTIGMTPRQVRKMISLEGRKITFPNILVGIMIGTCLSYIIQPEGWYWPGVILAAFISFLFGFLTMAISIYSPAKMASKVSPIEAVSYSCYSKEKMSKGSKSHKITPFRLAILNFTRNKKKTALTILSLGLCGVMLLASASMRNSLSEINMARTQEFQYGDFKLEFNGDSSILDDLGGEARNYRRAVLQANSNVFTLEFAHQILSIDGVTDIKEWFGTTSLFYVNGVDMSTDQTTIWGYAEDELPKMEKHLIAGTVDMTELIRDNGIIVNIAANAPQEVYHWTPKLGDEITLSFWDNKGTHVEKNFTVMGITDGTDGFSGLFRLPLEQLQAVTNYDITSDWEVSTDTSKNDNVEIALQTLARNAPELSLSTVQEYVSELSGQYQSGIFMIYVLVLFLAVFGIINLVNLTVTNRIIRKKESGIMLAVGLTKQQLRMSRIYEGELLVISSILIAALIGAPLSCIVINTFKVFGAVEQYLFPFKEYLLFFLALCLIDFILEMLLNRSLKQESLVELLKSK